MNAAKNWPQPQMLKSMSALLGQGFGKIAHPLAKMLKKNSFYWSLQAVATFISLKLITGSMLQLPDFTVPFAIECDASGEGVGVVLLQKGHSLTYFSKYLTGKSRFFSTYAGELLALVMAVVKWKQYLWRSRFEVYTDYESLKHLWK